MTALPAGGDRPLRGVVFDLFGTLIRPQRQTLSAVGPNSSDTFEDANTAGLLRWAGARGLPVPPEAEAVVREARRWLWTETGATGRQVLNREAMARAGGRLDWPQDDRFLDEAAWEFFQPEIALVEAYPDAGETLAALRQAGLRLALISNASHHGLVERVLERTGLAAFFDPIVSSAGFGHVKPDPGIFHLVLDRWHLEPRASAMVGDTLDADIAGAQAVGMRVVLVTMDPNPANERLAGQVQPDATVATLAAVMPVIRRWMGL